MSIIDRFDEMGIGNAINVFREIWGGVTFNRERRHSSGNAWTRSRNLIDIHNGTFLNTTVTGRLTTYNPRDAAAVFGTISHELAHVWDRREGYDLAGGLKDAVEGRGELCLWALCFGSYSVDDNTPYIHVSNPQPSPLNSREDFASTFSALIVDPQALYNLNGARDERRYQYMSDVVQQLNN